MGMILLIALLAVVLFDDRVEGLIQPQPRLVEARIPLGVANHKGRFPSQFG